MLRPLRVFTITAVLATGGTASAVPIAEPPDSQGNEISGAIETADTPWSGTSYDIRHVINPGGGHPLIIKVLSTDSRDDLGPRLAVNSVSGDTWVAWWRRGATDQVIVRKRINATGAWTLERVQSRSTASCRRPSVAFEGGNGWIAYEVTGANGETVLEAKVIEDDPAPFLPAVVIATTPYTGTVDARIQAEYGRLWVSWVDSATLVGWCRYDAGTSTWSIPQFESYAVDSVTEARDRVRSTVLAH